MSRHYFLRRRISLNLHPFPATKPYLRLIDRLVYVVSVIGPALTIPQIIDVYTAQDATGVSGITWLAYTLTSVPWLLYGVAHKEKVLIVTHVLWIITNATVYVGTLLY